MSDIKDNNIGVNIITSYTVDNPVKTGSVISTNEISLLGMNGTMINSGITLDDIHTAYVQSGNSGEAAYHFLTDYLRDNKDNSLAIRNTVGSILAELSTKYDKTNVLHGNVGSNQAGYLSTVFSSGKGEETSALICGTIHNFIRDALQEAGIEAVTVVGASIPAKNKSEFTNHACLMYKNSDGTYTFNNYGESATIEASNIKDAIYTVHKETGLLESGGQITIHDKNGSYQEYALSESSAFGRIIDKRNYNSISLATNTVAPHSSINASANVSSIGNVSASASATFAKETYKGAKSTTVGIEYKKSGENAEFYNSTSIGIMADHAQVRQVSDNTNLTYNIRGVYSHTTGELGGASYTNNRGETTQKLGGDISYETLMLRGSIAAETTIINNGNTQLSNISGASIQGYGVLGYSNHYSSSFDARVALEEGVKVNSGNFTGDVTGGLVVDTQQDNNGMKPALGAKLNAGASYMFKTNDNLSINTSARGYSVFTKSSSDTGLQATVGANWTNPNSNSKISSVWGSVGTNIENQNIHLGGTSQATERNVTFSAMAGMDINRNVRLSLNYSQSNHALNTTRNQKQVWATLGLKF